jgi:tetratricopeptide (TPR) repeat protein
MGRYELNVKKLAKSLALLACLASAAPLTGAAPSKDDLSFKAAFPRPFYEKSYFGVAATGATIVVAGTVTYLTAGAGAPAAATGVSTVASWVAGGGAGSYMAGLSTIGGWFGGNAMLGAAILNGVSLGTVGGMGSWATLSAGQKAVSLAVLSATALDGVALIKSPDTGQLEWQVRLPVPRALADKRLAAPLDKLDEATKAQWRSLEDLAEAKKEAAAARELQTELTKSLRRLEAAARESPHDGKIAAEHKDIAASVAAAKSFVELVEARVKSAQAQFDLALTQREAAEKALRAEISRAKKVGDTNPNAVVLAVMAHNLGASADFRALLGSVKQDSIADRSYYDYLLAIAALQTGNVRGAEDKLNASWNAAPYAIEPPTLLVGILGSWGYTAQEALIESIGERADKHFDADKYRSVASRVSLHYRVGTMALAAKRCERAHDEFKKAQSALSKVQKHFTDGGKDIRNLLEIGEANALYCQGSRADAYVIFGKVLDRTKDRDARRLLCAQFSGGCGS